MAIFLLAMAAVFAVANANVFTIISSLDGKVVTNTDYLEDPGPYNIYATKADIDEGRDDQRWGMTEYPDSSMSFHSQDGQYSNSLTMYKPCPSCFSASELWKLLIVGDSAMFISTWTDTCLTNPGEGYLTKKEACDINNRGQLWKLQLNN